MVAAKAVAAVPRPDLLERLAVQTAERAQAQLQRHLRTITHAEGPWVESNGRRLLAFCSNDYLGLAQHPQLIAALKHAADAHGVGSGSAHLICGHHREHAALEETLAEWTGRERALLFSTGYMANLGVMQALLQRDELCVQDKLNHACLLDGAQLAGATLKRYPHANADAARRQLRSHAESRALLATDGVFSMDGDIAPLRELAELCADEGATLMVDDAHGLGVLGSEGAGSITEAGLSERDVPILMATLGKALGCSGAFVAGSAALIDGLTQFARTYIYTTAMPPALAAAARCAVALARRENWASRKTRPCDPTLPSWRDAAWPTADAIAHGHPASVARRCAARAGSLARFGNTRLAGDCDSAAYRAARPSTPAHHTVGAARRRTC